MPTIFQAPESVQKKTPVAREDMGLKKVPAFNSFTHFAQYPKTLRFETQEEKEKVILFLRQHIIVNFPWVVVSFFCLFGPTIAFPVFFRFIEDSISIPMGYKIIFTLFWYVATFGYILRSFIKWFFNIYIVTDRRVVDIDFYHMLYKEFSEARLSNLQDVSYKTGGIMATIFDYGNVYVQTAGELPNFDFIAVPKPDKVVKTISELIPKKRQHV